jgi:dipeptidyl aminopeptidase/acylaminoacyl peptidase
MDGPINVPWFTSRDYLVFWPSIHFKMNRIGQSALDYVTSGAKYLSKQPWINPKAMGLQGHSFGGYETNYIVSHSKLFTAAVSAAGIADQISFAEVKRDNSTNWFTFHDSQFRIIDPVWKSPEIYLRNSPLFSVRRVNTPLLLMQNKDDYNTPYQFGINWYIALQRSGKKVWMLQYDKEEHKLENEANQLDYTTRVNQFFDYYLKGSKPPVWMTQGIPNWKKGVDNGLEQDKTDVKP